MSSSYFKNKVTQPYDAVPVKCKREKVSFRRAEAVEEATGRSYNELMLRCYAVLSDAITPGSFYISRAYNPNQVLVYTKDLHSDEIYLEILSVNVSTVHEPYDFGNVEI